MSDQFQADRKFKMSDQFETVKKKKGKLADQTATNKKKIGKHVQLHEISLAKYNYQN